MELTSKEIELISKWRQLPAHARDNVIKVVELFDELVQNNELESGQKNQ